MSKKVKHVLNVAARTAKGGGPVKRLRREGLIPAIVYSKGKEGKSLSMKSSEWESLLKYEFNLVSLAEEGAEERLALVKEVQNDPVRGKAIHVDFQEIKRDEIITAYIKIHAGHDAPVGLAQGGILEQVVHEMEVSCLPDNLPESVEVDVSKLNVGDAIQLKGIVLPEGVKATGNPEQYVFEVVMPAIEEEVKPAAAAEGAEGAAAGAEGAAAAEPEVIGEKERAEKAAEKEATKEGKKK